MEVAQNVVGVLELVARVVRLFHDNADLAERFDKLMNTVHLMHVLLIRIASCPRMPPETEFCIAEAHATLRAIEESLRKRVNRRKKGVRGCGFGLCMLLAGDMERLTERVQTLTSRMDLMLQLKTTLEEESRFDVAKILRDPHGRSFWDIHFGSETMGVSTGVFTQSLELSENRRLSHAEREVIAMLLDPDRDGNVSVYEFARWLAHFGPMQTVLRTTLASMFDPQRNAVYKWFHHDMFWAGVVAHLRRDPSKAIVRYGLREDTFVVDVCDRGGTIIEICVRRVDGAFVAVLCEEPVDGTSYEYHVPDAGYYAPSACECKEPGAPQAQAAAPSSWVVRALRIEAMTKEDDDANASATSSTIPNAKFDSLPQLLRALYRVVYLHPTGDTNSNTSPSETCAGAGTPTSTQSASPPRARRVDVAPLSEHAHDARDGAPRNETRSRYALPRRTKFKKPHPPLRPRPVPVGHSQDRRRPSCTSKRKDQDPVNTP